MIALIRIEIDEKHLARETNEIYDRLQGYNTVLMPLPEKKNTSKLQTFSNSQILWTDREIYQNEGYNMCIDEITGENE